MINRKVKALMMGTALLFLFIGGLEAQAPRFKNYHATFPEMGGDGAEPSLAVNRNTGNVMFQSGLETLRIHFDDVTSPAMTTWVNTEPLITSLFSLDPILYMDRQTGRTFVSQLDGACSLTEYTNDDGENWHLSIGCGVPAGLDHQSIGGGPYAAPAPNHSYPNAVYYCSQNLLSAICSRSDNGGATFGLGIPVYLFTQCGGRHGRVKVAPDGTVYLPNSACGQKQGVAVSQNNGLSWSVRTLPKSSEAGCDPSVGIGANNKIYFGYQNGDGRARIAVSNDRGITWQHDQDVGLSLGIKNIVFPAVVAGDNNRAAFAFLGTTTAGDVQNAQFNGTWYLYVATTFDGGVTWTTVNATPNDPVQYGSINIQTGVSPSVRRFTTDMSIPLLPRGDRNLLDFIDIDVDATGRILVGYADGCINECVTNPTPQLSRSALAAVARQSGGKRLYAEFDPVEPNKPFPPLLSGTRDSAGVYLSWLEPDNAGSSIVKYVLYRRTDSTTFKRIKRIKNGTTYTDADVDPAVNYYYHIKAVNSIGKSKASNEAGFPGN